MQIITGPRGSGRSTELVKMSARTGHRIICPTVEWARSLCHVADDQELQIPKPIPLAQVRDLRRGRPVQAVLVDGLEPLLFQVLRLPVAAMVMDPFEAVYCVHPDTLTEVHRLP